MTNTNTNSSPSYIKRGKKGSILKTFLASVAIVSISAGLLSLIERKKDQNTKANENLAEKKDDIEASPSGIIKAQSQYNIKNLIDLSLENIFGVSKANAEDILYKASNLGQTPTKIPSVNAGRIMTYSVKYRNTGNTTWYKAGNNATVLRVKDGNNGSFNNVYWPSKTVVAKLSKTKVLPNDTVIITFYVRASDYKGKNSENYELYTNGFGVVSGSEIQTVIESKTGKAPKVTLTSEVSIITNIDKIEFEGVQKISSTKDFDIMDSKTSRVMSQIKAGDTVEIRYNDSTKNYLVVKDGTIYSQTTNGIKIKGLDGVITINDKKYQMNYLALNKKAAPVVNEIVCAAVDCGNTTSTTPVIPTPAPVVVVNTQAPVVLPGSNPQVVIANTYPDANYIITNYSHPSIQKDFDLRVGIVNVMPATLKNNVAFNIVDSNKTVLGIVNANELIEVNYVNGKYTVAKNGLTIISTTNYLRFEPSTPAGIFTITSYNNIPSWDTSINYNKFRGKLELRNSASHNTTWLIEELNIEDYLKGSGESSNSSNYEYLKTMAIAERTYATYHYLTKYKNDDENFDVYSTTKDQAYYGYEREIRQANVVRAVDETRGIYILYNNNVIESLYSANSGGKTRTSNEAWGGSNLPYLQSVDDPYTKTDTRFGHGVGLSQVGAMRFIDKNNFNFKQVLKYYYFNVELKKLF